MFARDKSARERPRLCTTLQNIKKYVYCNIILYRLSSVRYQRRKCSMSIHPERNRDVGKVQYKSTMK